MNERLSLPRRAALAIGFACGCSDPAPVEAPDAAAPAAASWEVVLDGGALDRAVLSIWGTGPGDVWAVGGPLGNAGRETLAIHYDGTAWRELAPGGSETLWWVAGTGSTDVWMVGEKGRIVHWDGETVTEHASGTTATLWGVWAAGPDEAWAVGGTPEGTGDDADDVLLRWDGESWLAVALPGEPLGRALFKVWGTSSDDLYVVGERGTIWHRRASGWTLESDSLLAEGTLFTVSGCGETEVWAVGGYDVLRSDGESWSAEAVELTAGANGVACRVPGEVAVVGFGGSKQRLVAGEWIDDFGAEPYADLHAVWADGAGAFWAVGGDFVSPPAAETPREGVVARFGTGSVGSSFAE